jgi:dihydroorotate dehydrogenase
VFDPFPLLRPLLHALDPETAHEWTLRALETGLLPGQPAHDDPLLATELCGKRLAHPIGLAAGFDKNARVYQRMFAHGFSFVEVGGVTPLPQAGNPRPRVFRLPEDAAVINRMGFPNDGMEVASARMRRVGRAPGLVGMNLASNTESADPVRDFSVLVERFAPLAEYLVLDVSCPNTGNGQLFLDPARLRDLLASLAALKPAVPLFAKLSPDIDDARLELLVNVLLEARIGAIIVSNTTAQRPQLSNSKASERGGLSGRPLLASSTRMLATVRRLSSGMVPLVGVGGIASGADAYAKIRAGACALQLYTALIYAGTGLLPKIKRELASLLRRDGFSSLQEAIGVDAHSIA